MTHVFQCVTNEPFSPTVIELIIINNSFPQNTHLPTGCTFIVGCSVTDMTVEYPLNLGFPTLWGGDNRFMDKIRAPVTPSLFQDMD